MFQLGDKVVLKHYKDNNYNTDHLVVYFPIKYDIIYTIQEQYVNDVSGLKIRFSELSNNGYWPAICFELAVPKKKMPANFTGNKSIYGTVRK